MCTSGRTCGGCEGRFTERGRQKKSEEEEERENEGGQQEEEEEKEGEELPQWTKTEQHRCKEQKVTEQKGVLDSGSRCEVRKRGLQLRPAKEVERPEPTI